MNYQETVAYLKDRDIHVLMDEQSLTSFASQLKRYEDSIRAGSPAPPTGSVGCVQSDAAQPVNAASLRFTETEGGTEHTLSQGDPIPSTNGGGSQQPHHEARQSSQAKHAQRQPEAGVRVQSDN